MGVKGLHGYMSRKGLGPAIQEKFNILDEIQKWKMLVFEIGIGINVLYIYMFVDHQFQREGHNQTTENSHRFERVHSCSGAGR